MSGKLPSTVPPMQQQINTSFAPEIGIPSTRVELATFALGKRRATTAPRRLKEAAQPRQHMTLWWESAGALIGPGFRSAEAVEDAAFVPFCCYAAVPLTIPLATRNPMYAADMQISLRWDGPYQSGVCTLSCISLKLSTDQHRVRSTLRTSLPSSRNWSSETH